MDYCGYIIEVLKTDETDCITYKNLNTGTWDNIPFTLNYTLYPYLFDKKIEPLSVLGILLT